MKKIIFLGIIVAAALIQSTLAHHIRFLGVKPDLFFVIVFSAALNFEKDTAVGLALVCGILKDSLGLSSFGVHVILFPLWSLTVLSLSKRISFDHPVVSSSFLAVMVFVNAVILSILPVAGYGYVHFFSFMRISLIEAAYTSLVFVYAGQWLRKVAVSTMW